MSKLLFKFNLKLKPLLLITFVFVSSLSFTGCSTSTTQQVQTYNAISEDQTLRVSLVRNLPEDVKQALLDYIVYYRYDTALLSDYINEETFGSETYGSYMSKSSSESEKMAYSLLMCGDQYDKYIRRLSDNSSVEFDYQTIGDLIESGKVKTPFQTCYLMYDEVFTNADSEYQTELLQIRGLKSLLVVEVYWSSGKIAGIYRRVSEV